jgi:hypothetical protein
MLSVSYALWLICVVHAVIYSAFSLQLLPVWVKAGVGALAIARCRASFDSRDEDPVLLWVVCFVCIAVALPYAPVTASGPGPLFYWASTMLVPTSALFQPHSLHAHHAHWLCDLAWSAAFGAVFWLCHTCVHPL